MTITSKYASKCKRCGGRIAIGDQIEWSKEAGARHIRCPIQQPSNKTKTDDAPYRLRGGSGYGCKGWDAGMVVDVRNKHNLDQGWPAFVTVVRANRQYIRDDGMSFGVGDEEGWLYSAECRASTKEEATRRLEKIIDEAWRTYAGRELRRIAEKIDNTGERPPGSNIPEGERWFDTQDIYGGGEWFTVGPTWIWHCVNNGRDGDNWSCNNVQSGGGAGAIGIRVPRDEGIIAALQEIKTIMEASK